MEELRYQVDLLTAMNQKLNKSERMYHLVCDVQGGAFLYILADADQVEMLGNWSAFFDFSVKKVSDLSQVFEAFDHLDEERIRRVILDDDMPDFNRRCECNFRESKKYIECSVTTIRDDDNRIKEKIIKFTDVTRFHIQREELSYLAFYDTLTGLYNRNHFVSELSEMLVRAEEQNVTVSVIFIDIDDFKRINDGKGIIVGDELVQVFGQYLGDFSSENVNVSHFNSDIYCISIYDPCGSRSVEKIIQSIKDRLAKPFKLTGGNEISFSVCMGVAEYPESAKSALELIGNAEIVMFKAKSAGKNGVMYFDSSIINEFQHSIYMENKLNDAMKSHHFVLNFQPQYYLNTNKIRGVEALIRMRDNTGRIVGPGEFIAIAEQNGSIVEIGDWVIEEALSVYSDWRSKYKTNLIMSINISAIQYKKDDFVQKMIAELEKYKIDPKYVELEITESVLIDDFRGVVDKMRALRDYGLKVSLDDFGTGYSSLSYLKDLPIDTLKIDKSFIDTVITDDSTRIIIESIVTMVKKLGYETVAEGVETAEQFEYLKKIECDNIQGFYLGRPQSAQDIENILIREL
ncbi:MAG: bifunctional diguanylate cyclase/phosphodiesterase [Lachnospiraceae bacterium]|nr:bifunctional diguanylate cyclase/phosphodiesterase [Candidatus Merdinaster equi]